MNGLCKTGLAFSVFIVVGLILQFIPFLRKIPIGRYILAAALAFVSIMFVAAMGAATDTYFTDVDNYPVNNLCDSYASAGYSGYFGAVLAFILAFSTAFSVIFPCCNCIDRNPKEESSSNSEAVVTANPIA